MGSKPAPPNYEANALGTEPLTVENGEFQKKEKNYVKYDMSLRLMCLTSFINY